MSLRLRLTFLSAALVGLALAVIGTVLYLYFENSSYAVLDSQLREQTAQVANTINKNQIDPRRGVALDLLQPRLDTPPIFVQLLDLDGNVLAASGNLARLPPLPVSTDTINDIRLRRQPVTAADSPNGTAMRLLYTPVTTGNSAVVVAVLQAATPVAPVERQLDQLRLVLLATGALALVLVGLGAWWTTGRALGAVDRITAAARNIARSQDLNQRIAEPSDAPDDEMARLVRTFNSMLDRLSAAFQAQKQFVADSSHELRSPLTVIKGNLELWRWARTEDERQEAVTAIEQETARMTRLVENLLLLAQMEAAPASPAVLQREVVELDSLLLTVYQQARVIDREVHHIILAHEDAVMVRGNRDQMQQLLLNLIDNAIKYTPAGSTISLALYGDGPWARLEVADSGPGIPADDLPHIFDRFYRSDKARSRTLGGAGLGLAIVREVAESHGGRVEVTSVVGQGTVFRVWLPRTPNAGDTSHIEELPATDADFPALPAGSAAPLLPTPDAITPATALLNVPLIGRTSDETRRPS